MFCPCNISCTLSDFYEKSNGDLIKHATTTVKKHKALPTMLVNADATCLKSAGAAFKKSFTQRLSVMAIWHHFGRYKTCKRVGNKTEAEEKLFTLK